MRLPRPETALLLILAVCGIVVLTVPPGSSVRVIAGVLLMVLPGVALAYAIPARGERGVERLAVALGSLPIVAGLGAVGLNAVGIPLTVAAWALLPIAVTALATVVITLRRACPSPPVPRIPRVQPKEALFLGLALALLAVAIVLGTTPLGAPATTPGYAALSIRADGQRHVTAVAQSDELKDARYRMVIGSEGHTLAKSRVFELAPGDRRELRVPAALPRHALVRARLYETGDGSRFPTRRVRLTSQPHHKSRG